MTKLHKQENLQILSIVFTAASDSDLMIGLINQTQIFRFLNKPVKVKILKNRLKAALAHGSRPDGKFLNGLTARIALFR